MSVDSIRRMAAASMASSGVSSIGNFIASLLVVRAGGKEDFGVYGLITAISLLALGAFNAAMLVPYSVRIKAAGNSGRTHYDHALFLVLYVAVFLIIGIGILALLLLGESVGTPVIYASLLAAATVMLEAVRRTAIIQERAFLSVLLPVAYFLFPLTITALVSSAGFKVYQVLVIGFFASASVMVLWRAPLLKVFQLPAADCRGVISELLSSGKWSLGGMAAGWAQSQSYVFLTSYFFGLQALAEINAAKLFVSPVNILSRSMEQVITPFVAKLQARGRGRRAGSVVLKLALAGGFVVVLLYGLEWLAFDEIVAAALKGYTRADIESYVWLWQVVAAVIFLRALCVGAVHGFGGFRNIALIAGISSVAFVLAYAVLALGRSLGPERAIYATIVSEVLFLLLVYTYLRNKRDA